MARISRSNSPFNDYSNSTVTYLDVQDINNIPNYERLGLTVPQRDEWVAKGDAWNLIYPTYVNVATRTVPVTANKQAAMDDFIVTVQPLLDIIAASPAIIEDDYAAFNIKKRDTEPTPRPAITTVPYPEVLPLGGGKVRVTVRVQSDSTRASMHPDADSIEVKYTIGTEPPASEEEAVVARNYRKSIRVFSLGQANATLRMYAFFRWSNETDESKSGPWSTMVQTVIA